MGIERSFKHETYGGGFFDHSGATLDAPGEY